MKWIAPHGAVTSTERYKNAEPLVAGSNPDAAFFNDVLDELLAVITTASMTPTDQNMHQIADAIVYLTERAATSGVTKGSYWFGKTTANFSVPAPTAVGQTYIDFTNLKTYISNNGSTWTQSGTFVPPTGIDFTILITSKFWDITEQTDQQGGDAIYSHSTQSWTYWPKIVNLNNAANLNLSNLTSTGKNFANWSSNVTNCITNIPQDINIQSPSNNLVLQSGSKVYVPNGPGVYTPIQMSADVSRSDFSAFGSGTYLVFYSQSYGGLIAINRTSCVSGSTDSSTDSSHVWYDTANNKIKVYQNGSYTRDDLSLPLAIVEITNGTGITSIGQVFNGIGSIGSTIFALPGVSGLTANGQNNDGTWRSTAFTLDNVKILNVSPYTTIGCPLALNASGFTYQTSYFEQETNPGTNYSLWYKPKTNYLYRSESTASFNAIDAAVIGTFNRTNGVVSNLRIKQAFRAADYNDVVLKVLNVIYPVDSIYIGTGTTCPLAALFGTWTRIDAGLALWTGNGSKGNGSSVNTTSTGATNKINAGLPNITGQYGNRGRQAFADGCFTLGDPIGMSNRDEDATNNAKPGIFNASNSSSIYGNSTTVQPPAYVVNVWRRTA